MSETNTREAVTEPIYEIKNLEEFKDSAPEFGFGEIAEARFADGQIQLGQIGFSHHRIKPGMRQAFGHQHEDAEEVYVVMAGTGQIKLDDEVREISHRDVIRLAPEVIRCLEAGPEGIELLAFGASHPGDGEILPGWWT